MNDNHPSTPLTIQTSKASEPVSRRDFLSLAWKSLLGLCGIFGLRGFWRFLSYQTDPTTPTAFDLGPLEQFPLGIQATIPEARAALTHTSAGIKAYSLVCPHLGCTVEPDEQGFSCPCHGSSFAPDGSLIHGPADRPLDPLRVEQTDDGKIILHTI